MDSTLRDTFLRLWRTYFARAELPITFYYADDVGTSEVVFRPPQHRCVIAQLAPVREGRALSFAEDSIGCGGGKRYLGFTDELHPNFEYFLSYGIPGELEGERYKKTPGLVGEMMRTLPAFKAPGKYVIFKRWDRLDEDDSPQAVIFLGKPDVLSGLFTLANYDRADPNGVFSPFCAGCGAIVQYPFLEKDTSHPRAVLGMFDVSARPCVPSGVLSFAVPIERFVQMTGNMDESFLITHSWERVQKRL